MKGERRTVQLFIMRLNYSHARFVMAFPFQKQEAFFEGHVQAFHFFGAVPRPITYDNLQTAVLRVLQGRNRQEQAAFVALRSHHLFESRYCTPRQAHEKGGVESDVGLAQRNLMAPLREVNSFQDLNPALRADCRSDIQRRLRGRSATEAEKLAAMTLGFSLLTVSLLWSAGQRIDTWTFLVFNVRGRHPRWLDILMSAFTQVGNGVVIAALALILYFAGDHLLAYGLILGALTLWLVVELLKALVRRGRPFIRLAQARIVGIRARGRSFPSGHTSQAFFMATLLVGHLHAAVWAVCLLYATALVVGITRMYVGAHYPRDVLAGAVLGTAWGLLAGIVYGYVS